MGLGNRTGSVHETLAAQKYAVRSEDYADFRPEQRVMTCDGFPGTVTAVLDGPFPGTEAYAVKLDNEMGHGEYRTGQLAAIENTTASVERTAAEDYPELGSILTDRPDIALG
jgi:hypothetical protein